MMSKERILVYIQDVESVLEEYVKAFKEAEIVGWKIIGLSSEDELTDEIREQADAVMLHEGIMDGKKFYSNERLRDVFERFNENTLRILVCGRPAEIERFIEPEADLKVDYIGASTGEIKEALGQIVNLDREEIKRYRGESVLIFDDRKMRREGKAKRGGPEIKE